MVAKLSKHGGRTSSASISTRTGLQLARLLFLRMEAQPGCTSSEPTKMSSLQDMLSGFWAVPTDQRDYHKD